MAEYFIFLAKAVTIVVALIFMINLIASLRSERGESGRGRLHFNDLSAELKGIKEQFEEGFKSTTLNKGEKGEADQKEELNEKRMKKSKLASALKSALFWKKGEAKGESETEKNSLFVLEFDGDMTASTVENLRREVNALLLIAKEGDEVLVKVKSPGGVVHSYGLAAAQLARIRDAKLPLTVAVDEVAASGGYLMAAVADYIIAAPFAVVGSIGVVAQLPNFHRLLERFDIDYEQFTAGNYKRTVTMFGENDDEGRAKFKEDLADIHESFKSFVHQYRPQLDIERIATGEHWLSVKGIELGLVDEIKTSDAWLLEKIDTMKVYGISYRERLSMRKGLSRFLTNTAHLLNR